VSSNAFQDYSERSPTDQLRRIRSIVRDVADRMELVAGQLVDAVPQDTDILLLSGTAAPFAYHFGEAKRIPSVGVYWGPTEPTGQFPPPMVGARSMGWWGNKIAGHFGLRTTHPTYAPAVRRLRQQLGLPPASFGATRRHQLTSRWPVLHGFSPLVFPRPHDWRAGMDVVGYWWPERPRGWEPPSRLLDFLDSGPPPVFVGLGSMAPRGADRFADQCVTALKKVGARGVVQAGWADLSAHSDDVMTIGSIPHDWLFPRMAATVHHAGAGTTGASLRAGVPSVPVPVAIDQPFWAARLVAMGTAPESIPFSAVTTDHLARAVRTALDDPSYKRKALRVAAGIEVEDGAGRVAAMVDRLVTGKCGRDN
jgi:hypothetical protein